MAISFDRVSDIYDATRGFPSHISDQVTDCILRIVSATPDLQFFEIGVGTGRIALPIAQRGYAYTGVDISERMLAELRRKIEGTSYQLFLQQADATSLPFTNNTFDVALTVHVLHLIPDWQLALAEIRRVLKPTGTFLYTHGRTRSSNPCDIEFNQARLEFYSQWRSILASYGFQPSGYGANEAEVLAVLQEQGATVETIIAAQWQIEQTVGELLDRYRHKMYSSCWQIPDDVFAQAIDELTAWCQQHYSCLDTDFSHETQFKILVVKDWAFA